MTLLDTLLPCDPHGGDASDSIVPASQHTMLEEQFDEEVQSLVAIYSDALCYIKSEDCDVVSVTFDAVTVEFRICRPLSYPLVPPCVTLSHPSLLSSLRLHLTRLVMLRALNAAGSPMLYDIAQWVDEHF